MRPVYLFVTPFFPSPTNWRGGYCYDMVRALMRTGEIDIHVFVPGTGPDYDYQGIRVHRFPFKMLPFGLAPFLSSCANGRFFVRAIQRAGVDSQTVAYCHVHTIGLAMVGVALKRLNPLIHLLVHHHCINPIRLNNGRLGVLPFHATAQYFYYRGLCRQVDAHIFCSQKSRDSFGKLYEEGIPEKGFVDLRSCLLLGKFLPSLPIKRSIVYYNGYDPAVFHPAQLTTNHQPLATNLATNHFTIGCVANFQPLKDIPTLIRAFKIVADQAPEACLRLVGSGETKTACEALVRELGLVEIVSFEKEVDHLTLPDFYRSLDVFVLPSRTEGFCCSYIESLGCGVPVFGCDHTSLAEAFHPEERQHWLVPSQNPEALAEKILAYRAAPRKPQLSVDFDTYTLAKNFLTNLQTLFPLSSDVKATNY